MKNLFSGSAHFLFWSWNIIFLAFILLGFAPMIMIQMIIAVQTGMIPVPFLVFGSALASVPLIAVLLGVFFLRDKPALLLALGYGVEGPLMLLLGMRFFILRELTPPMTMLIIVTLLALCALLWQLLDRDIDERGAPASVARLAGLTLLLAVGLYASAWLAFYAPPVAHGITLLITEFPRAIWDGIQHGYFLQQLMLLPFMLLGGTLFLYSATLFVLMPLAVPVIYSAAFVRGFRAMARFSPGAAFAIPAAIFTLCALTFAVLNRQPQGEVFALLAKPPASAGEAADLLKQESFIRDGLLNAYLAPQRYVSAVGEVAHVSDMYQWALSMPREQAQEVERLYSVVARPLLYEPVTPVTRTIAARNWVNPSFQQDSARAAQLYEQFFDQPIQRGERETIVNAVRTTWLATQAQAAWEAVDDREVLLMRQEVTISEHGDWADVELYEVYQNQTERRQEVVYYFSLPESAVVTGVWLGNSPDRAQRFVYRVSPRGAAQSLYRNEVRQQRDPALVEQIGPRQYRLRIFPIEPKRWRWTGPAERATAEEAPQMHLWLTWRVLVSNTSWRMPQLAEKLNVYWDDSTTRLMNGKPMNADGELWLPLSIPATTGAAPTARRVGFANGVTVLARPLQANDRRELARNARLAVVLDRSKSMAARARDVRDAFARLRELANQGAQIDVYLTSSPYRGEAPSLVKFADFNPDAVLYFGGQDPAELLSQFNNLQSGRAYDAILILTDDSSYEMGEGKLKVSAPDAPMWMIHLGGLLPLGYDDHTLTALQASGGGVAAGLDEALARMAIGQGLISAVAADISDGYVWYTAPSFVAAPQMMSDAREVAPGDPFAAFAARRLILAEMQKARGRLDQIAALDALHRIAREQSIVTPFSSMIVLVNEAQQKRLDELEKRDDRFQREKEEVAPTTPENNPVVTGVPEPHEWLLIGVGVLALGWYLYGQRRARASR